MLHSDHCPACGAYIGKQVHIAVTILHAGDTATPPCGTCGQPYHVQLNLGRHSLTPLDEEDFLQMMATDDDSDDENDGIADYLS